MSSSSEQKLNSPTPSRERYRANAKKVRNGRAEGQPAAHTLAVSARQGRGDGGREVQTEEEGGPGGGRKAGHVSPRGKFPNTWDD